MNRKELRRMRRFKNTAARARNRAWTLRNLGHWCNGGGQPLAVMDDPSDEHVQALLLSWLTPRAILEQAGLAIADQYNNRAEQVLLKVLTNAQCKLPEDLGTSIWSFMTKLAYGAPVPPPPAAPPIKVW